MDVNVGDWVMFIKQGAPTLGVVLYLTNSHTYPHELLIWTNVGQTSKDFILEVRKKTVRRRDGR